ncbi:MAG TPA: response regulator [Thermoanaerobaculia bacterium]|jgi:CheY-like chemotaxis protein|nr:response regulator [Thermoanaerobaculia bacterium]
MRERLLNCRALVVEDDNAIHLLLRRVLEREGFSVDGVKNGEAAIERLKGVAYDLLIIDLIMPQVSGEQVLEYLDETQPASLRRVVITTASPRLLSRNFLKRVCCILTKPFDVDQLVRVARECAEHVRTHPVSELQA